MAENEKGMGPEELKKAHTAVPEEDVEGHSGKKDILSGGPEGLVAKAKTAIPGDESGADDVEGHKAKSKWDGGPEGLVAKAKTAIPGDESAEDDVEGHKAKSKWDGGPEGLVAKAKTAIPTGGEEEDVEGHVYDLSRGTGGELIDRKLPGGDSPHGESYGAKLKV